MKRNLFIFTILLIGFYFTSCVKSEINYENDFEKSHKEWLSFTNMSGNSYRYLVTGSSWVGSSWQTVITVTNGKITQRYFKYNSVKGLIENIPQEALEWTEDENEINSHEHTSAAEGLTVDQIYNKARNEWLIKRKNSKTYFEANNNGLISSCGYVEDNCMDDCFRGINIAYIVSL
jgi:major membrane immunogen (membrane-anchored lipoprotein)